ncbi:MAG: DUF222 domain-containing protein [Actinomycetota bacterium]
MFDTEGFQEELRALDDQELDGRIADLASNMAAGTYRWLLLIAELDDRGTWADWGALSCEHWLSYRCGITPSTGRDQLRVAHRLKEMPLVAAHLARGELSYSQVRALARVVTQENEADLVNVARNSTAAQLEKVVRVYRQAQSAHELDDVNKRHDRRGTYVHFDDDGTFVIRGRMSPEAGATVNKALEHAGRAVWKEDHEDGEKTRADALVHMAEAYLSAETRDRSGGDATQVVLHVDPETLVNDSGDRCELEGGTGIHPETARRLSCDASVVSIIERDGEILSVGRKTRTLSSAIRRALKARDKGCCRYPGCTNRVFLDGHHIQHWTKGGETKLGNLCLFCRKHHRFFHEGGYTMQMEPDGTGLRIWHPNGWEVPPVVRPEPARTTIEVANADLAALVNAESCRSQWDGGRIDPVHVVNVVAEHEYLGKKELVSAETA